MKVQLLQKYLTQRRSGASQHMTKTSIILIYVYIILIACVYIQQFNFFNNVPMAQWSTLMPCNREAAGSNLWGFGFYLKGAHYEVDYSGKKLT